MSAVSEEIPTASSTANGVSTSFPYNFTVLDSGDLVVKGTLSGATTTYSYGVDYTISGLGSPTGSADFMTPPAAGTLIVRYRDTALKRTTDYQDNGDLLADTVNDDFNRLWYALQEFMVGGRGSPTAVRVPDGETATELPAAGSRLDRLPVFNISTGDVELSTFTATQLASAVAAAYAAGATADAVTYLPPGLGATSTSVQAHLRLEPVYPEDWGATGLDVANPLSATFATLGAAQAKYGTAAVALTDELDGVVLQSLINNDIPFKGKVGAIYRTSRGIKGKHGMKAIGAGRWSGVASTFSTTGGSTIRYVGAGGANSYVALLSAEDVSIEPVTASTRDLQNVVFRGWTLDGNDLAEYGLIEARAWAGNDLEYLTITNTRKCGNLVLASWVSGPRNRHIYKNRGAGAWLGKNVWGWANFTVDQAAPSEWLLYYNGCDQSGNPYNVFADDGTTYPASANPEVECGLGIFGSRALKLGNLQCQNNSGPGLYVAPVLKGPIHVDGGYFENNGRSLNASRKWYTWTTTTVDTWAITYEKVHFGGTAPAHRLTGTQVSRDSQGPKFVGCPIMGTVVADAAYTLYNLIDCDTAVTIVGGKPASPFLSTGGLQTEAAGDIFRYKTGSFSPTLGGTGGDGTGWAYSASNNLISWVRNGDCVTFTGTITLTTKGTGTTGTIIIKGLPYTAKTGQGYNSPIQTSKVANLTTSVVSLTGYVEQATTRAQLYLRTAAAASETAVALADLANTTTFMVSGHYFTSDAL